MSKRFDQAVAKAKRLPPSVQDRLASLLQAEFDPGKAGTLLSDAQIREIEKRLANPCGRLTLGDVEALVKSRDK